MTPRLGRADLHIHTPASDGTSSIEEILAFAERETALDVIAITDHERIDGAVAAQAMADHLGLRVRVIVGEEITTRGGHLVGLFLTRRVPPLKSMRWSIQDIHDQGGIAFVAHPFVPVWICAQGFTVRRLLDDPDPAARPDAIETFNPTAVGKYGHTRALRFAEERGMTRVGNSDAHVHTAVGSGYTTYPGHGPEDLRSAILAGTTHAHGNFHGTVGQLGTFGRQLRKYGRDARDELRGRVLRDGTGRDHGYPGGRARPPRFEQAGRSTASGDGA